MTMDTYRYILGTVVILIRFPTLTASLDPDNVFGEFTIHTVQNRPLLEKY